MKNFVLLLTLLISIPSFSNDLTVDQERNLLTEIDNICGDTWCEGDFDFSFEQLDCNFEKGKCQFKYELIWYEYDESYENLLFKINVPAQCTLTGFNRLSDLEENQSYSEKLYESVSDCILEGEEKASKVLEKLGIF